MARIRSIKPEFWTDETLGECSPTSRLLFVGIWTQADDYGNLDRSSRQLKAQVFPYDSLDVEPLIQELLAHDLVHEYEVCGKRFLHVPGFYEHQKIEKRSKARYPLYEESARTRGVVGESSPRSSGSSLGVESSRVESSRAEEARAPKRNGSGKGKEAKPTFDEATVPGLHLPSWQRWIAYRVDRKPAIKPSSMQAAAEELAAFGDKQAIVVQHSIANGYQGLFAPKGTSPGALTWKPSPEDFPPETS